MTRIVRSIGVKNAARSATAGVVDAKQSSDVTKVIAYLYHCTSRMGSTIRNGSTVVNMSTTTYLLRHIPDELWTQAKARATKDGRPLRQILLDLLRYYIQYGLPGFKRH